MTEGDVTLLDVGRITKPHGLRGELLVQLTSTEASRLDAGSELWAGERRLVVERAQPHLQRWIVVFEGVASREDADALVGLVLRAEPLSRPDGGEGEDGEPGEDPPLWVHELIGCDVVEVDGTPRGRVTTVLGNPASDLLELDSGGLVPLRFVVGGIEPPAAEGGPRVVRIDPPAGLFDT